MNYLTNVKNVTKLSQQELQNTNKNSWHDQYKDSAWIYIGGLPFDLTEGDIICIFSQYGEVVNINLIRAKDTGKSKGFCFLCYEDQRSTILAVDNFNGIKILNRTIRVDHVQDYKAPKDDKKATEETKQLYAEGCAPKAAPVLIKKELPMQNVRETLADQIEGDIKLPARLPIYTNIKGEKLSDTETERTIKKEKKKDKKKKTKKKSKKSESSTDDSNSSELGADIKSKRDRASSEERDRRNRSGGDRKDRDKDRNKYSKSGSKYTHSSDRTEKYSDDSSRTQTGERDHQARSHRRDVSPSIPKRWR